MKSILLYFVLSLLTFASGAQVYYLRSEFGLSAGASHYYGDLNQLQGINMPFYSGSVFYKYNFNHYISLKTALSAAKIGGDDKLSDNIFQQRRNLNFQSNIFEASIQSEFNFLEFILEDFEHRLTPYISLGVAYFHYDPYTYYNDKKFYLKPIGTEGQNLALYADRKYSGYAFSFPIGLGVKYWMSKGMTATFEICNRLSTTDYIDDVSKTYVGSNNFFSITDPNFPIPERELQDRSYEVGAPIGTAGFQRGISSTKDQYIFAQIGLGFRLKSYKCPR